MKLLILFLAFCLCLCACHPAGTPDTTDAPQPSGTDTPVTTVADDIPEDTGEPGLFKPGTETEATFPPFTLPADLGDWGESGELVLPEVELDDDFEMVIVTTAPADTQQPTEGNESAPPTTSGAQSDINHGEGTVLPEIELED